MNFRQRIRNIYSTIHRTVKIYRAIQQDPKTPVLSKWLFRIALGYALFPVDIVPDFIPILGHVDDMIIVPLLIILALKLVPPEVIEAHQLD